MKNTLKIISYIGLGFTIISSFVVFNGLIAKGQHFLLMVVGVILWFASVPFWMKSKLLEDSE